MWQITKSSTGKQIYNKLKNLLNKIKNEGMQEYLKKLTLTKTTKYLLFM